MIGRSGATSRRLGGVLLTLLLLAALVPGAAAREGGAAPLRPASSEVAETHRIGLITGDVVTVQDFADGHRGIEVQLAERDGYEPSHEVRDEDGQLYVIPSDALTLIGERLDRELFNVTKLVEYGYDVEHGLPLIVMPATGDAAEAERAARAGRDVSLSSAPGVRTVRPLTSIGAEAVIVDAASPAFWRSVTRETGDLRGLAADGALAAGTRIWLDEQVAATLDGSVPMIGAPQAWAEGLDGSGIRVAVLDTGIDETHPDLTGRVVAAENFSFSSGTTDRHGHGTHVAGIVGAGGGASDGTYVGVAPGVELLNGKVLGDGGTGFASAIIEGMEWAVAQGADVVNMSLGTTFPSDGNDPVSLALDQLSETHGVLFVTTAGNTGPGAWTIGAPGAASRGLTVAAVDRAGELTEWSSQGPRLANFGLKPEVTAPGLGIVSARASEGWFGTPVGEHHARLSGTSMAAPHVAGAAAILLQADPSLDAAALKAALVTTAEPNGAAHIYRQGGGLIDIPSALDPNVRPSRATVGFGTFGWPHDATPPVAEELTLTSSADETIELALTLDVRDVRTGAAVDAAMLSVEPASVTLEPGDSATVEVRLDVRSGAYGLYGGYLVASDVGAGDVVSRVPTGFNVEAPTHTLTIEAVGRDGQPAGGGSWVDVIDVHDVNAFSQSYLVNLTGGSVTVGVPDGTYSIVGRIHNTHPVYGQERSIVSMPELSVTADTTVVLDARTANRIEVETPAHETAPLPHVPVTFGYRRQTHVGQSYAVAESASAAWPVYASETDAVTVGGFELMSRWLLGPTDPGASPVLYDLVLLETDAVPSDLRYAPAPPELAGTVSLYHADLPNQIVSARRFVELSGWDEVELAVFEDLNVPVERVEYRVPGVAHREQLYLNMLSTPNFATPPTVGAAGELGQRSWLGAPLRPGIREGGLTNFRLGDTLHLSASPWVDAGGTAANGNVSFAFYRDGTLVGAGTNPSELPLSSGPAEYRLELTSAVDRSWWRTSPQASTAWTLQLGAAAGDGPQIAPFVLIDYELDLDLLNSAPLPKDRKGAPSIGVAIRHAEGAAGAPIAGARLWTSDDDGASWRERPGRSQGAGRFTFRLDARDRDETSGFTSLRVEAWDADGNRIEQEIIRAYQLPARDGDAPEPPGVTERVSLASDGSQADRLSQAPPAISADGRYVAFASLARNLVPGDPNVAGGVFVRDRVTGTTERASVSSDGAAASGNAPAISADGRYVAFASFESYLVPGDTNNAADIFVHDRQTGATERVSVASDGSEAIGGASSSAPAISSDGRLVAFASSASNLVPGDTNNASDIFVHDRQTGVTERVSVASDGSETGLFSFSSDPSISADGRYVAFTSSGSTLVPDDTNNTTDVFVRDRQAGTTERVSVASDGSEAASFSMGTSISADGSLVAFASSAANLVPGDTNGQSDMFVHDRLTGLTERASVATDGSQGNGFTSGPALSGDGRYVGFASGSSNLVAGDTNNVWDIFVHDRVTGTTARESVSSAGAEGNLSVFTALTLDHDGRHVAFVSSSSNLVPGDTNRQSDTFIRDRAAD
jgi:subtilisin family serine protease/Tol biopolymer transport system component